MTRYIEVKCSKCGATIIPAPAGTPRSKVVFRYELCPDCRKVLFQFVGDGDI